MSAILKRIFPLIVISLVAASTMAQVDPSSVLLLKRGTSNEDYSSSRYTVKPKSSKELPKSTSPQEAERKPQVHPLPEKSTPTVITSEEIRSVDITNNNVESPSSFISSPEQALDPDVFMDIKDVEKLKRHFHPQDPRKNILEFSLGVNYFYQDSNSRYWHRDNFSHGPGIDANLNLWVTPFLGVHAGYSTSLNSNLRASPSGLEYLDADHAWFSSGLRFRKFFGLSRKAKSLNFGVDYYEYQLQIPTSSADRMGLSSKGVSVSLEIDVPERVNTSWQIGFELQPDLSHNETIGGRNIKSGRSNNSSAVGLWYGRKLWLNRKNQFYWQLSHKAEINKYSGMSSVEDPRLGDSIRGVTVNNSTSFFQMGFTWGR